MKNSKRCVSVCMITYNHANYISEAIEGVLNQKTDFDYEIVIGEDCSSDQTREIVLEYKKKYPEKIKLILQEKNVGALRNLTDALNACNGKYIAFCEGDDYWIDPNKLQIQIGLMNVYPELSMSFHPSWVVTKRRKYLKWKYSDSFMRYSIKDILNIPGQFAPTASVVIKSEIVKKLPDWFQYAPIGDFFIEIYSSLNGEILYIPKCMSVYRSNTENSFSKTILLNYKSDKVLNFYNSMLKYYELIKKDIPSENIEFLNKKIASTYYGKSLYYLVNKNYSLFIHEIQRSYGLSKNISLLYRVLYKIRKLPKLARLLYILKIKILYE